METASDMTTSTRSTSDWSPARVYLVVSGVFLLVFAGAGFLVNSTFPIGTNELARAGSGHTLGIFETNGWHSLAGVISGIVALGFALKSDWARFGAERSFLRRRHHFHCRMGRRDVLDRLK